MPKSSISKDKAEEISLQYLVDKKETSDWNLEKVLEEDRHWVVYYTPKKVVPEILVLYIDKKSGNIVKVETDS